MGWTTFGLYDDGAPEDIYEYAIGNLGLDGLVSPPYIDFWRDLSLIVHVVNTKSVIVPNMLTTTWNQDSPFNDAFPIHKGSQRYPVGCVPVAIGQVMKYHDYPSNLNLSTMADYLINETDTALQNFLFQLAENCNAKYETDSKGNPITGVDLSAAPKLMKSKYGYTAVYDSYNSTTVRSEISDGRPLIVSGGVGKEAHAFVACGLNYHDTEDYYQVFTFTGHYTFGPVGEKFYYTHSSSMLTYYNWGKASNPMYNEIDGYFQTPIITDKYGNIVEDYSANMQMMTLKPGN